MLITLLLSWLLAAEPPVWQSDCIVKPASSAVHHECPSSSNLDVAGLAKMPREVVSFDASRCQACQKLKSILDRIAQSGIRVEHQPQLAQKHRLHQIPAHVFVARIRGMARGSGIEEARTGRLMFGVGANSGAGLVGSLVLDEQNCHAGTCSNERVARLATRSAAAPPVIAPASESAPGAVQSELLIRATYELCPEKAKALTGLLKDFGPEDVETRLDEGKLTVTARPEVQQAVGRFIAVLLNRSESEVACPADSGGVLHAATCPATRVVVYRTGECRGECTAATACRRACSSECQNECNGECTEACKEAR